MFEKIRSIFTSKKKLYQEIDELKNQVYNLTLYLKDVKMNKSVLSYKTWKEFEEQYDGLPGYQESLIKEYWFKPPTYEMTMTISTEKTYE